jgi:glycosyltransferase involved in cell wall biosynthesis
MRALHRVLLDRALRDRMKERSYQQAAKFSWEKSVRRMMDVYREIGDSAGDGGMGGATEGNKETTGVT